jgi:hypothetical protein
MTDRYSITIMIVIFFVKLFQQIINQNGVIPGIFEYDFSSQQNNDQFIVKA